MLLQWGIIVFCGLIIGLGMYFFVRTIQKLLKGKCCEGCEGCPQADHCSSKDKTLQKPQKGKG